VEPWLTLLASFQIIRWRQNENAFDALANITAEVPYVAGNQVSCLCFHVGEKNGSILFRQRQSEGSCSGGHRKEEGGELNLQACVFAHSQ
jgi:hypothetical protein